MMDQLTSLFEGTGAASAIFAGGAGVAAMGMALGLVRSSSRTAVHILKRQLTTTLEVTSKDVAYPWILHWLKRANRNLRHVSVATLEDESFELVPSPGRHLAYFRGWPLLVDRAREYGTVNTSSGTPWERVTLTAPAFGPPVFQDLLETAREQCHAARNKDETLVLTCWGTEWRQFGQPRRKRPLNSVVLAENLAENIVTDVQDWLKSDLWYRARGVPYRRGYLLHGPPGSGKTSFVLAVAAFFDLDVCLLSLSEDSLTDDRLALALANVPSNALVLLEDVDAAFVSRTAIQQRSQRSSLTLSGLLNALDGAAAAEGRLVFMTTNFLDRLDAALLRPGRVDVVKFLDDATETQAATLFRQFFGLPADDPRSSRFAADAVAALRQNVGRHPSMAELQAFLIEYKHDPDAAVANAFKVADLALDRTSRSVAPVVPSPPQTPPPPAETENDLLLPFDEEDADRVAADLLETTTTTTKKGRGPRFLTADEVDKLPWNPQPGWEDLLATPDPTTGKLRPPPKKGY